MPTGPVTVIDNGIVHQGRFYNTSGVIRPCDENEVVKLYVIYDVDPEWPYFYYVTPNTEGGGFVALDQDRFGRPLRNIIEVGFHRADPDGPSVASCNIW